MKPLRPSQISKMNTLSRLISGMSTDENPNDSGLISNDSGIITEDLWYDGVTKPFAEKTLGAACNLFGIVSSRSFTAPPTPASTVFWKGSSEFSPNTAFSQRRSRSGYWDKKHQSNDVTDVNVKNDVVMNVGTSLNSCGKIVMYMSSGSCVSGSLLQQAILFHLARVALDDSMKNDTGTANYKCVKIENGDRMAELIERTLEKHLICGEFCLPEKCNPYYAVAPDPTSTMLNFVLRRKKTERVTV
uniref:Uncharacterized protein n=1 Tax=Wuchereria bancrofti TaxID=6293 RepID=A0A1I8ETL0_WUCBA